MTTDFIARLEEAGAKASDGPWREGTGNVWHDASLTVVADTSRPFKLHLDRQVHFKRDGLFRRGELSRVQTWDNAAFIALARNVWSELIAVVRSAHAINNDSHLDTSGCAQCADLSAALAALKEKLGE